MTTPEQGAPTSVGLIVAGLWLALGLFGCIGTGLLGAMSESAGVNASYLGVPLFFGGLFAMIVAPLVRSKGQAVAIGAPVGVGCAGFLVAFAALVVFYVAIWPSL